MRKVQPKQKSPVFLEVQSKSIAVAESAHATDFKMAIRADPFHKVLYLQAGCIRFSEPDNNQTTSVEPGGWWPVAQGIRHCLEDEQPATLLLLGFSVGWCSAHPERSRLWKEICRRKPKVIYPDAYLRYSLEQRWRRMLMEQQQNRIGSKLVLNAEADSLLVDISRVSLIESQPNSKKRIRRVIQVLKERFYESWSLDEAADLAELSRRRFSALFRKETGGTFLAFLTKVRLEQARKLIKESEYSITGAAFSCGFEDLSHFYRIFRKTYGMTPGDCRKKAGRNARKVNRR